MSTEKIELALRAANPVGKQALAALDLAAGEAELGRALVAESAHGGEPIAREAAARHSRSAWLLLAGAVAAAATAVVLLLAPGGASPSPEPAYGAELVRFAESTPLLLLEGPGWRVQNVYEASHGPYAPEPDRSEGSMEFVTGPAIPYESVRLKCVRQVMSKSGKFPICTVDTRAEFYVNQGGPGNRQMTALWSEDGYVLELKAAVPDLAAFEERLGWLTRVDSQTWLDAMPAKVVKAADHDAAVREMLKGIPVPKGFTPSQIPDEGLTTDRYQVGASVTGIVSCLWFRQWGEARRAGDRQGEREAERAMATSKHWAILREMAKDGAYPETVWQLAKAMPSGVWRRGPRTTWRLLPRAEGLGCARWGLPVLPWKQRRQNERRDQQTAEATTVTP